MWSLVLQRVLSRWRVDPEGYPQAQALHACWQQAMPSDSDDCCAHEFLVVDLETSSLSADDGELLSVGWVVVSGSAVRLASAEHHLLANNSSDGVGDSALVHQLRDCELEGGLDAADMLSRLLSVAAGRVLVFHHCDLDLAFLNKLSRAQCGSALLLPVVDTLQLDKQKLLRRAQSLHHGVLTLAACRQRYGLPDYPGHNALVDALATAELLLAQLAHKGPEVKLSSVLFSRTL